MAQLDKSIEAIARRRDALRQARADNRIEGLPEVESKEIDDYVEGKISGAEAERRILARYKK